MYPDGDDDDDVCCGRLWTGNCSPGEQFADLRRTANGKPNNWAHQLADRSERLESFRRLAEGAQSQLTVSPSCQVERTLQNQTANEQIRYVIPIDI